jgi:hypothetical protein
MSSINTRKPPSQRVADFTEIVGFGVKAIIAGSAVGELALHYLDRFNIIAVPPNSTSAE